MRVLVIGTTKTSGSLRSRGFRARHRGRSAANGAQRLALQRTPGPPTLIVTDIFIAEMEGIETIHEPAAGSFRCDSIIAMSGRDLAGDISMYYEVARQRRPRQSVSAEPFKFEDRESPACAS